jgi:glycosyltransferase involved in cell wall biosynthesis
VPAVEGQLDDGVDALLVDPGDDAALARALEVLLYDSAIRDRLGRAVAARARSEHSWSRHVSDLYAPQSP